jgi:uncharacterized RDD family membrane protein YckC
MPPAAMPILNMMNAIGHASAPPSGPKLDNRRVLAALIDLVVVGAGGALILAAAGALGSESADRSSALAAVILGWALYYYFACEASGGQTLGKRLLKLRVLRADGAPVGMREVAVRSVLRVVDGIGLYLVGLIVMLATGERRGRLGDLAAGTIVADASRSAAPSPAPLVAPPPADTGPVAAAAPSATITLPERPQPPVVEALAVPEPVAPEPARTPDIASPSLRELARDVAEASAAPAGPELTPEEPGDDDEPEDDEPVTVKSVETVSAIDLVMGSADEDTDSSPAPDAPEA